MNLMARFLGTGRTFACTWGHSQIALWVAPSIHLAWPNAAEPPVHREVTGCCLPPATC